MMRARPPIIRLPLRRWLWRSLHYFGQPARHLRGYDQRQLRADALAGLTVAVVLLPQAIAYALIAELPPQTGLYTAIVAAIVGALWGSSYHLQTGPTNAASLVVLSSLVVVAAPGSPEFVLAAGLMAILVGVMKLVMGLFNIGFLVYFVADSVIVGFTAGAGVLIAVNQINPLLRLEASSQLSFFQTALTTWQQLPQTHWPSLGVGVLTLAIILFVRFRRPRWPNALISMTAGALVVAALNLTRDGVQVLGDIPRGLPPLTPLSDFDVSIIPHIWAGALAAGIVGLVEAMSIARSLAAQSGQHLDTNQEFIGQGLANIASGLVSGYTGSGSFTRSAVNYESGGRTVMASVFSGVWALGAVLLLGPLAQYLPRASLAAVLIITAYFMVDRAAIRRIWHASGGETVIMAATFLAAILFPLQYAILAGVVVSFIRYIQKTATPGVPVVLPDESFEHFTHRPDKPVCPQLSVMTIQGSLYFGSVHHVEEIIRANMEAHPEQKYLLLRMHHVNHCDISGINMLETIVRLYRQNGGDVYLMRVLRPVLTMMQAAGFDRFLGLDHFLPQETAISYLFYQVLNPALCIYACPVRAWRECQTLPKSPNPQFILLSDVEPAQAAPTLKPADLWARLSSSQPPLLVDVRELEEWAMDGYIPGSVCIPMPSIFKAPLQLPPSREIVLVCRTGRRSRQMAGLLHSQGWVNVFNLNGGVHAWRAASLPLETLTPAELAAKKAEAAQLPLGSGYVH